jgi:hypothetical protein
MQAVPMEINSRISLQILYLTATKRENIYYTPTGDSDAVLVAERNDAGLEKPSSSV